MLLLLTAGTGIGLSGDLPPEMLLLARFKQKVRQDVGRLANCTCLETIERSGREPGTDSFQFLDRVRLEVTTAGEKELLTWPGGAHFEDWAVTAFVKSGLVASGMFASHARNLFLRDGATFQYGGPEEVEGRSAVRYDFKVSRLASLYRLRTASGAATVATKGSFWFDAGSLELIRLDEFADQIPEELGLTGALTRVRYGRITDAVPGVLLPQSAEVELRHSSGELRRNKIEFAQCREYRAESSISFGATELTPEAARSEPARVDLPAGLTVKMELESGFDSATAAIGDPVRARVIENVRRSGKTIIPKGAIVTGRIRSMERQPRAGGFCPRNRIHGGALGKRAGGVSRRSVGSQRHWDQIGAGRRGRRQQYHPARGNGAGNRDGNAGEPQRADPRGLGNTRRGQVVGEGRALAPGPGAADGLADRDAVNKKNPAAH